MGRECMKSGCDSICLRKTSRGTELSSARPGGSAGVVVEGMSCGSVIAEGLMFARIGGRNLVQSPLDERSRNGMINRR